MKQLYTYIYIYVCVSICVREYMCVYVLFISLNFNSISEVRGLWTVIQITTPPQEQVHPVARANNSSTP